MVRVRGAGGGRVSIAGVACCRPGDRPHLFYQLRAYRRRKGEAKGFAWADYRDLTIATDRYAINRRITGLYAKAVEHSAPAKLASVRLGGLYALKRLIQHDPAHNQIIV